jgi:imidazolonepropionase-like amidohydrolase
MRLSRLALGLAALLTTSVAQAQSLAIVHARAWTGSGETAVDDATILVRDGKIVSVAPGTAAPAGLEVVDAAGKIVTPGLFSGATQIGLMEVSGAEDTADEAVSSGKLGAAFDIAPALNSNSLLVEQARGDGIIWALSYPSGSANPPFLGQAALLRLQDGQILERSKVAVFVRIGGGAASNAGGSRAAEWTLLSRALDEARLLKAGRLPPADDRLFSRIDLEALQSVITGTAPLAIQTDRSSDIRQAIRLKRDYQLNVVLIGATEAWTLAGELARERIPVILDPAADLPISYDALGARLDNAAILDRAGVALGITATANLIDTNYNVGVSSRMAAGIAVANGLSYASAIRSLTLNPATIWGASAEAGSIAPGKDADLVVWDGDPLEPSSAPAVTIVAGRRVSTLTREQQLARRYSPRTDKTWPPAYH